jgi:molybdopterin synthase sulfur carrier subunit
VAQVKVRVPTQLRELTGGEAEVGVEGDTVGEALNDLVSRYPALAERLFDENGNLRRFVNVFVSDEDLRYLDGLATRLTEGQTISIVPAVAGGS